MITDQGIVHPLHEVIPSSGVWLREVFSNSYPYYSGNYFMIRRNQENK